MAADGEGRNPDVSPTLGGLVVVCWIGLCCCWVVVGWPGSALQQAGQAVPGLTAEPLAEPRVRLNHCDWPELCVLPSVNETLARRLIADRERHGAFHAWSDLTRVPGIGVKTARRLRAYLDFSPPAGVSSPQDRMTPRSLK